MVNGFLVDTNVISELRKGSRADAGVVEWYAAQPAASLFLSVLTLGELRRGVLSVARRDAAQGAALATWLGQVTAASGDRLLTVDERVADQWARLMVPDPLPVIDALLAATALVHGLTVVTRNAADFERTGVPVVQPFS